MLTPTVAALLVLLSVNGYLLLTHGARWVRNRDRNDRLSTWMVSWGLVTTLLIASDLVDGLTAGPQSWVPPFKASAAALMPLLLTGMTFAVVERRTPRGLVAAEAVWAVFWTLLALNTGVFGGDRLVEMRTVFGNVLNMSAGTSLMLVPVAAITAALVHGAVVVYRARDLPACDRRAVLSGFVVFFFACLANGLAVSTALPTYMLADVAFVGVTFSVSLLDEMRYDRLRRRLACLVIERTEELQEGSRALEAALEDARAAGRATTVLLQNMSHEIRTPLNGVIGAAALLEDADLPEGAREAVDDACRAAEDLLTLTEGMLELARIEAGDVTVEDVAFDPGGVVEGAAALYGRRAASKGIELVVRLHDPVPATVSGDPVRLAQIVRQLVDNAVKFTDSGSVVVNLWGTPGGIEIEVADTGCGMDVGATSHMFRPFVQGDSSSTKRHRGVGSGLSLVEHVVDLIGGEIVVESTEGAGTSVVVRVPARRVGPDPVRTLLTGTRIVVAAASEQVRAAAAERLSGAGAQVVTVPDVSRAAAEHCDVALVDGVDVPEVADRTRRWAASGPGRGPRLVALGGVVAPRGFAAAVGKPVTTAELLAAVAEPDAVVSPTGERRVLVVEDDPVNRRILRRLVEREGFAVDVAADGAEAIDAVAASRYEVVLMDCAMPVLDGYEATRRIRAGEAAVGGHVPIVAVTANALSGDREKCIAVGMDDFVTKPVRPDVLAEALGRWTAPTPRGADKVNAVVSSIAQVTSEG